VTDVRPATEHDVPRIIEWGRKFLAYHPLLKTLPEDVEAIEGVVRRLIEGPDSCILIHETGMIGGALISLWTNPSARTATELFWWSDGGGLGLLEAFEAWGRDSGASHVQMLKIEGVRDVSPIYAKRGYAPMETVFVRSL
jgi:hypothetical protein